MIVVGYFASKFCCTKFCMSQGSQKPPEKSIKGPLFRQILNGIYFKFGFVLLSKIILMRKEETPILKTRG